jgi:hypothetical protein
MSQIQSRRLPLLCQRALLAVFSKPLRGRLRKANDQIKDTLKALGLIEAKGLIIVVNDGNYGLELDAALYCVFR